VYEADSSARTDKSIRQEISFRLSTVFVTSTQVLTGGMIMRWWTATSVNLDIDSLVSFLNANWGAPEVAGRSCIPAARAQTSCGALIPRRREHAPLQRTTDDARLLGG
jgi:hypothetical protein